MLQHFERERPGLARLLVSGYMTPELAQQVFDSTKIRVLLKPFEFPVLVNWLAVELVRADHTQRLQRPAFAALRSGPLVLLIDDEPMVRRSLELLLVQAGFAPVVAADASEALLTWEEHREIMSVVVSDYSLGPGRNGLSLLEEFAAERSDLVCILMSAYLTPELIASLSSHSRVHCLAKPFQFAELKRLIDTGLAQRRRASAEAQTS